MICCIVASLDVTTPSYKHIYNALWHPMTTRRRKSRTTVADSDCRFQDENYDCSLELCSRFLPPFSNNSESFYVGRARKSGSHFALIANDRWQVASASKNGVTWLGLVFGLSAFLIPTTTVGSTEDVDAHSVVGYELPATLWYLCISQCPVSNGCRVVPVQFADVHRACRISWTSTCVCKDVHPPSPATLWHH